MSRERFHSSTALMPSEAAPLLLAAVLVTAAACPPLQAQVPGPPGATPPPAGQRESPEAAANETSTAWTVWQIVFSGGWPGFLILLLLVTLSIGALALCVEHLMTIRHRVLIPAGLAEQVRTRLAERDAVGAAELCRTRPSFLSFVLLAALAETDGSWPAVEKALEDATAEQAARLFRKIEYLSVIGNIAPMVGLLGTVVGMIFAFQEVADTQGAARAAQLASGIYQALVTTVGGLIVAIPSLAAFAVFRNRVDQLAAETAYAAQHATLPLKQLLMRGSGSPADHARRRPPT